MAVILSFDQRKRRPKSERLVSMSLLNFADSYGLHSGLYLHFGHMHGGVVRACASTLMAQRQYADLIAESDLALQAFVGHRPFAWSSREVRFARRHNTEHAGIAVPVQDHVNGPGLVALIGVGIEAVEAVVADHGPSLSWAATDIHVAALEMMRVDCHVTLSAREMQCLRLVAEGMSNVAIARELGIVVRTVEYHLGNAMEKLGAATRINAVAIAASQGLLRCEPLGRMQQEPAG